MPELIKQNQLHIVLESPRDFEEVEREIKDGETSLRQKKMLVKEQLQHYKLDNDYFVAKKYNLIKRAYEDKNFKIFINESLTLLKYLEIYQNPINYEVLNPKTEIQKVVKFGQDAIKLPPWLGIPDARLAIGYPFLLAGETNIGKTRYILNIILECYIQKEIVYVYSTEMEPGDLYLMLYGMLMHKKANKVLSLEAIKFSYIHDPDSKAMIDNYTESIKKYVKFFEPERFTPIHIAFSHRQEEIKNYEKAKLVIVDHFHDLEPDEYRRNETKEKTIAEHFRPLIKKANSAYIVLGHLSTKYHTEEKFSSDGWKHSNDFPNKAGAFAKIFYSENDPTDSNDSEYSYRRIILTKNRFGRAKREHDIKWHRTTGLII